MTRTPPTDLPVLRWACPTHGITSAVEFKGAMVCPDPTCHRTCIQTSLKGTGIHHVVFECAHRAWLLDDEHGDGSGWCQQCGKFRCYDDLTWGESLA